MDIGGITKKVLLNILVKVLGEFVELDENNLSVAIISGQVALHNLKLRTDNIFKKFNFHIFHGALRSLEITIPWNLVGSAWKIRLDGILIDVGPPPLHEDVPAEGESSLSNSYHFGGWSAENLQCLLQKALDEKMQKLKVIDEYLEFAHSMLCSAGSLTSTENSNSESYIQQLTTRIIDNIEISLTNIHVRYEDSLSIPGERFAAGVTLEAFNISTCDDFWRPAFVSYSDNGTSASSVKKLATIQSLGIYWETSSESIADLPFGRWTDTMLDMVHTGVRPSSRRLNYILAPAGSGMYMKFTHFKRPADGMPRFDVLAESNDIKLNIDNTQYQQLFYFLDKLKRKTVKQFHDPNSFQPFQRPTVGNSRLTRRWWRYAKDLILIRKRYVRLVKLKKKAQAENVELEWYLKKEEMLEMSRIEDRLPVEVLKKFRSTAIVEFYRENKQFRITAADKDSKSTAGGGWFSWSTPSSSNANSQKASSTVLEIDKLSIAEVVEQIDRMESEQSKKLFSSVKVQLSSSSTIVLSSSGRKLVECKGAVTVSLQKSNKLVTFGCFVSDICIEDAMNISPFHTHILSMKSDVTLPGGGSGVGGVNSSSKSQRRPGEFKPTLSILIENLKGRHKITISALPVEVYLNKLCIQTLLGEFALPKKQMKQLKKVVNVEQLTSQQALETALLAGTKFSQQAIQQILAKHEEDVEIVLDVHAPKIIVPEDCTKDAGFLLLDCGFLSMKGVLCGDGMTLAMSLKNVNAGLPIHIHDLYSLEDLSLYLIKPFDLNIEVQSIEKKIADMTVTVEVSPEVRGEVDAVKLARLLKIINGVGDTFNAKKLSPSSSTTGNRIVTEDNILRSVESRNMDEEDQDECEEDLLTGELPQFDSDDSNSDGFRTPMRLSMISPSRSVSERTVQTTTNPRTRSPATVVDREPTAVSMRIGFKLPSLALDLTYDHEKNNHVVFTIEGLMLDFINRTFDRKIVFVMQDFSIEDSIRHPSQRFVAWTPKGEESLVHVSFAMISNARSPLYNRHASEIDVTFADLRLNVDVTTLLHLKPFFEVLLDKKKNTPASAPKRVAMSRASFGGRRSLATFVNSAFDSNSSGSAAGGCEDGDVVPTGTKIDAVMRKFTVDILRPYSVSESGMLLDPAFSMRIVDMRLNMDMMDLMTSDLRLRTFDIVDMRTISRDYVFRNIFSPTAVHDIADPMRQAAGADEFEEERPDVDVETGDLLHLVFMQETKSQSLCNVVVSGITSFVAIDAILDFAVLASSNFFTFTSLFKDSDPPDDSLLLEEQSLPPPVSVPVSSSSVPLMTPSKSSRVSIAAPITTAVKSTKTTTETSGTFNAIVTMTNSRLILLEDPALPDSRAIVGQCKLDVHFSKDQKVTGNDVAVCESVHVTVSDNEVFVLKSMKKWAPLPILEPFDVEFHMKKLSLNDETTMTDIQVEMESIDARLSFNDLVLAHSIFSRRSLAQEENSAMNNKEEVNASSKSTAGSEKDGPFRSAGGSSYANSEAQSMRMTSSKATPPPISLIVRFGVTSMSAIVVNDFNTSALPVLRLAVGNTTFYAEGIQKRISGEGSSEFKVDYFNAPLLVWEPVLETWKPSLRIFSEPLSTIVDLKSEHTLQLTVSGAMLETLLRTYTLFFHEFDHQSAQTTAIDKKDLRADIVIFNSLGDGIDIQLFDSSNKSPLLALADGESSPLMACPPVQVAATDASKKLWMKTFRVPHAVDIYFRGSLDNLRKPLLSLPFNIAKLKACTLQTIGSMPSTQQGTAVNDKHEIEHSTNSVIMEPIEEEIYENSRYDPLAGKWRNPFFFSDPYQWTDGSGLVKRDMQAISIRSDRLEWTGDWEVDMDGVIGSEIDDEGWEYATSFGFFSMVSVRRCFQPLDSVRRRRWTRTRVPKLTPEMQQQLPLTVIWDVQTLKSGSRNVYLRSGFQIVNDLDIDIFVCLHHPTWTEDVVYGPICVGQHFDVPLLHSYATQMKFRPVLTSNRRFDGDEEYEMQLLVGKNSNLQYSHSHKDGLYSWSGYLQCNMHSYDFKIVKEVSCEGSVRNQSSCWAQPTVHFRCWTIRDNKILTVRLVPFIEIRNKLLCNVHYRCSSKTSTPSSNATASSRSVAPDMPMESHSIPPGSISKLRQIHSQGQARLAFQVGTFDWSADIKLNFKEPQTFALEMKKVDDANERIPIVVHTAMSPFFTVEVNVFFKVAMIDRTGLNLAVKSVCKGRTELIRRFNRQDDVWAANPWKSSLAQNRSSNCASAGIQSTPIKEFPSGLRHSPSSVGTSPSKTTPFWDVEQVEFASPHFYEVSKCDIGISVYSDAAFKWSHLPYCLREQTSIKLPLADRFSRMSSYMQFTVKQSAIVFVLVDNRANRPLPWLRSEDYVDTGELAVAKRLTNGQLQEINYRIYGKLYNATERVVLGGSWDSSSSTMYSVVVVGVNDIARLQEHYDNAAAADSLEAKMSLSLFNQIIHNKEFSLDMAGLCWTECCKNIMAFYSTDNVVSVSSAREESWSEEISIDTRTNSATKGSFSIDCPQSSMTYHLSYTLENLPGLYQHTQIVTFMPRFCLLNCMDEVLYVAQKGSHLHTEFLPYRPDGWHVIDPHMGMDVLLRTESTIWSLGAVSLNEIGSTVLYIPHCEQRDDGDRSTVGGVSLFGEDRSQSNAAKRGLVVHVEVKVAEPTDFCSIIVVIWQETIESQGAMSINNDSDIPVTIRQSNIELDHDLGEREFLYELTVPPGKHIPFGWTDPDCGKEIQVCVGNHMQNRRAKLNFLKQEQRLRLPFVVTNTSPEGVASTVRDEVILNITTSDAGHVLHISKSSTSLLLPINEHQEHNILLPESENASLSVITPEGVSQSDAFTRMTPLFGLNIFLSSLGISLVVEKPIRREFLSLYIDRMEVFVKSKAAMKTLEFSIMDLQIDNYSETRIYPILLRSSKKDIHRSVNFVNSDEEHSESSSAAAVVTGNGASNSFLQENPAAVANRPTLSTADVVADAEIEKPFIQLTIVQDQPRESKRPILKYVAFRMLSLAIEIDSASMQLLFLDLFDDLKILTNHQALALTLPNRWLTEFNRDLLAPNQLLLDVHRVKSIAQQSKIYIRSLVLHPMKVTVTFFQSTFPRADKKETLQSTALNFFMSLVGVEKMQLKLSSFEVEDAMESTDTLVSLVTTKVMMDLRSQLAQIAGSLAMIGSPIGFARKVGSGVRAFFYEPYLGAIHGSQDFFSGLKKGTGRLIGGVVAGAMDSGVALFGTASKGISYLSGDIDYVRHRALKRQQQIAEGSGVYRGLKYGGESFVTGITSGVTGLVTKPIQGAANGGMKGFFQGIGLGLLGAAVKPIVGLTEGLTSIAYGISSQVDPNSRYQHVRPPRALEPSHADASQLIIMPLNLESAYAQDFVIKRASQNSYHDVFITYLPLDQGGAVILSDFYVFWRKSRSLWGRVWSNISHVVFLGDSVGVLLYSSGSSMAVASSGSSTTSYTAGNSELVIIPCSHPRRLRTLYTTLARNAHRMGNPSKVVSPDDIDWPVGSHVGFTGLSVSKSARSMGSEGSQRALSRPPSVLGEAADSEGKSTKPAGAAKIDSDARLAEARKVLEVDGYRFGSSNDKMFAMNHETVGTEQDVIARAKDKIERACRYWQLLDEAMCLFLWEWAVAHKNLAACRCSVVLIINHSASPVQITRIHMLMGRQVVIMGSDATGYEMESRLLRPRGYVVVFFSAFPQSPLEAGHFKGKINASAFTAVFASNQRETTCEAKGGFVTGFLEKTVSEWWSKFVVHIN